MRHIIWWRRRGSNPRPQILCLRHYMFSFVIKIHENKVNEQTFILTIQLSFADILMARIKAILC